MLRSRHDNILLHSIPFLCFNPCIGADAKPLLKFILCIMILGSTNNMFDIRQTFGFQNRKPLKLKLTLPNLLHYFHFCFFWGHCSIVWYLSPHMDTSYQSSSTREQCYVMSLWHILRYRAHFSLARKVFSWILLENNQSSLFFNSMCIYFAYQLTLLAFWMGLDTFQAKLVSLDQ